MPLFQHCLPLLPSRLPLDKYFYAILPDPPKCSQTIHKSVERKQNIIQPLATATAERQRLVPKDCQPGRQALVVFKFNIKPHLALMSLGNNKRILSWKRLYKDMRKFHILAWKQTRLKFVFPHPIRNDQSLSHRLPNQCPQPFVCRRLLLRTSPTSYCKNIMVSSRRSFFPAWLWSTSRRCAAIVSLM